MTFVIIGGGIDLSVGALMALASVWATPRSPPRPAAPGWGRHACALLVGVGFGLVNGLLIATAGSCRSSRPWPCWPRRAGWRRTSPTSRPRSSSPTPSTSSATNKLLGTPAAGLDLRGRRRGRLGRAQPHHVRPAHLRGRRQPGGGPAGRHQRPRCTPSRSTSLSGLCCGIAAIMIAAQTTSGSSTHGDVYELDAIAAVIIGGTLLAGGRGTIVGSVLGVLVFTTITNLFILNNLQTEVQNIAKGVIIVVAVLLQRRGRRLEASRAGEPARARPPSNPQRAHSRTRHEPAQSECDGASPDEVNATTSSRSLMSDDGAGLDRRRFLLGAVGVGAGALLTACTSNKSKARRDHDRCDGRGRRRSGGERRPPGTAVTIGFSAPAADHGWIGAITKNAASEAGEVLRRQARAGAGDQRRRRADRRDRDADQQEGRRHRDAAVRRQAADRGRRCRRWRPASRWSTSTGSSTPRGPRGSGSAATTTAWASAPGQYIGDS